MKREQKKVMELENNLSSWKAKAAFVKSPAYSRMGNRGRREQTYKVMYPVSTSKHLEIMTHIHTSRELWDFKQQAINFVSYLFVV